jgi:nitrous oxide reductase
MGKVLNFLGKKVTDTLSGVLLDLHKLAKEIEETDFEKEFNTMKQTFKDLLKKKDDEYVLEVKYDRETQTLQFKIEDDTLTVIVEEKTENGNFNSKSTTTVTIPSDVLVDKITQEYDSENKIMFFKMKKTNVEEQPTTFSMRRTETVEEEFEPIGETKPKEENEVEIVVETPKTKSNKPMTSDELLKVIVGMYKDGASFRAISKEVGLSDKTVAKYIKRVLNKG